MKKLLTKHALLICFSAILFLAAFLRLYKLDTLPGGLSWDEAAIGYNGYGILTVHRDEWLNRMPITFKSFGDYKAAVAVYLNAASIAVFGVNAFAIRFPMAIAGVVTTVASYFIGLSIFKRKQYALLTMLLVAISPINVHFSRIAFESGIAVSSVALGVACMLYAPKRAWLYVVGAMCLVISLYTYHSTKIAVPLFIAVFVIAHWKAMIEQKKWVAVAIILGAVLLIPLVRETLYGHAADRFFMASQITNGTSLKPLPEVAAIIAKNYVLHFSPAFAIFGASATYRHGNGQFGVLSFIEVAVFILGILTMVKDKELRKHWWILVLFLLAILPASIGDDAPHSNRAHLIVPWVQVIAVFGVRFLLAKFPKKHQRRAILIFILGLGIQLVWQANVYTHVYSTIGVRDFQYGYKEAVLYARSQEGKVDKVLFTSAYGQPYIFVLLYKQLDPIQYQQGALANYEIRDLHWDSDKDRVRTLIVGTPDEIPADAPHIVKEIAFPDGKVAFRIVEQ